MVNREQREIRPTLVHPPIHRHAGGIFVTPHLPHQVTVQHDPEGPILTRPSRQEELGQIAAALTALAGRFTANDSVIRDFGKLVTSARNIATAAREINISKWMVVERAKALVQDLASFAIEVETTAEKAAAEVRRITDASHALLAGAARIEKLIAEETVADDRNLIAAELAPMEATLTSLHSTGAIGSQVSQHAARLATRAAELAEQAIALQHDGRVSAQAALAIHEALTAFVQDAQKIATVMAQASTALNRAAALVVRQANAVPSQQRAAAVSWFT